MNSPGTEVLESDELLPSLRLQAVIAACTAVGDNCPR
jgi:hypothetical protein